MHKNRLQTIHLLKLASLSSLLLLHLFHKRKYRSIKTRSFSHIHGTLHFKVNHVIWVEQLLPLAGSTKLCPLPVPVRFYLNQEASRRRRTKIIFDIILNLILPFWYLGKWHYTPPECRGEMNSLILSHPVEEKNPIAVFTSSRKEKSHGISFSFSFPLIILLPSPRLKYHGPATFLYYKVFTLHEHQL